MLMQTTHEKDSIPVATRITEGMKKAIQKVLLTDGHLNIADYLRDLVRKDLEHRGMLEGKRE
jgi:hypothetical protein